MRHLVTRGAALAAGVLLASSAHAQFSGSGLLGDFGVKSGSQPAPGFYASGIYYRYDTDTVRNADGDRVGSPDPSGELVVDAFAPIVWYVSKATIFGAHYGVMGVLPGATGSLEAPSLGLSGDTGTHLSDLYLRPIDLGWHGSRADYTTGLGFYAPTGEYEPGGSENTGKGMWTTELFAGTTQYLDQAKSWSLATSAYWEIHGKKEDTDIKVGQILTLEGGVGKSFLGGGLVIGAAYYASWKLTADDLGVVFAFPGVDPILGVGDRLDKHRVFAIGPDVTLPLATKKTLYGLLNLRYLWETGARTKTEGQSLFVTATFPIPSVKLK